MNPRTRRQRRQARKWGPLGWHYKSPGKPGANTGGRMKVLCPIGFQGDPWTTRMRWYTPSRW